MTFAAILFDLDGTILDTTPLILSSLRYATGTTLGRVPEDSLLLANFGRPLEDSLRALAPELDEVRFQNFLQCYLDHNWEAHDRLVALVPGVEGVLRELSAAGVPLAVVTSKRRDLALRGLDHFGLGGFFKTVVAREDTQIHKPDPEPVREGIRRLGADASRSLYIGDSPFDMRSGRGAGCHAWGIIHNTFSASDLVEAGAERVAFRGWSQIGDWLGTNSLQ